MATASVKKQSSRKGIDIPLKLECYIDELSPAQIAAYTKAENEFNDAIKKVENLVKKSNATIIDQNDSTTIVSFPSNIAANQLQQPVTLSTGGSSMITNAGIVKSKVVPTSVAGLPVTSNLKPATTASLVALPQVASATGGIVTTSSIQQAGTYQLVMDPRLGLLVSTVPQQTSPAGSTSVPLATGGPVQTSASSTVIKPPQTTIGGPRRQFPQSNIQKPAVPNKVLVSYTQPTPPPATVNQVKQKSTPAPPVQSLTSMKPKSNAPVIDLTDDDGKGCASDSREVNFNNMSGKTFPSLVVVARPHLRIKELSQSAMNEERKYFNDRVKGVLMFTPTKFTEWLIQQGLVRSEHYCSTHTNADNSAAVKLKLGMYSDLSKFPYSGGYVWISECCPQRFVSVFSGSIFEGAPHAPTVLLKLLYHWCSQTSVQNVLQWVKVEKLYVKTFYTHLRAICTAAICEKFEKLGGQDKKIEVGVISLGTTSADGSMRQVKVEVLGVMDSERKVIRLRAIEPVVDADRNVKKRFVKILEPLELWVHKESTILTDNTVDKSTLLAMGFKSIHQVSIHDSNSPNFRNSNFNVMEYLRRVVPRMFQNTLSLLSKSIIQQFLDELVWRERWGHIPSKAFDSMIEHIAEQTKIDSGETLTTRLATIAANPFRSWLYSVWFPTNVRAAIQNRPSVLVPTPNDSNAKRPKRKFTSTLRNSSPSPGTSSPQPSAAVSKPQTASPAIAPAVSTELTSLESYYYGTIPGNKNYIPHGEKLKSENEKKCKLNMKCCICRTVLATNVLMLRHLVGHVFNEGAYTKDDNKPPQCRYCLMNFVSEFALQSHLEETHLKVPSTLMCLICEEKFSDRTTLILHMHRNHTELELPYECYVCGFRTSEHRLVVDHFYEKHDEGEKVQCPYCLKIVAFSNNGKKVTQNLYFFINHIQKHQRKTLVRKCSKCTLWFVHKGILKEHQDKYHVSCKGMPNIERYTTGFATIMMPKPLAPGPLVEKHQIQKTKDTILSNNFTTVKFDPPISFSNVPNGATCSECEGDVAGEGHFEGNLACLRCRFSTCCNKSMYEHLLIFHDSKTSKEFSIGKIMILDKPMHCVCGFKSASGNKLAKHLALCGRKSAYPSAARAAQCTLQAQSANFPPLVTLDDQEPGADPSDTWLQAFVNRKEKEKEEQTDVDNKGKTDKTDTSCDPPSMLNVLGLVRKQSLDESSLDKPASDSESVAMEASQVDSSNLNDEKNKKDSGVATGLDDATVNKQESNVSSRRSLRKSASNESEESSSLSKKCDNETTDEPMEVNEADKVTESAEN